MAVLAGIGQEAVRYLSAGTKAPEGWKAAQMEKIAEAKKPGGLVRWDVSGWAGRAGGGGAVVGRVGSAGGWLLDWSAGPP